MRAQLEYTFAHRCDIARIAQGQTLDAGLNAYPVDQVT